MQIRNVEGSQVTTCSQRTAADFRTAWKPMEGLGLLTLLAFDLIRSCAERKVILGRVHSPPSPILGRVFLKRPCGSLWQMSPLSGEVEYQNGGVPHSSNTLEFFFPPSESCLATWTLKSLTSVSYDRRAFNCTMNTHNITIDDALNSTSFAYQPAKCSGSGWNVTEGRGYLGTFRSCTTSAGPSVAVSFEGVAVYYRSAYIAGGSIRFKLDGVLSDDIDLSTPPGQAVNNTATNIFWTQTGLSNTAHLLELLPGSKSNSTLTVDALTVTQVDVVNLVNATTANIPDASALAGAAAAAQGPTQTQTPSQTRFALGLGIAFGTASFIVFIFICVFLGRRRRQLNKRYTWSKPIPPIRPSSSMYSRHATGHTGTQGLASPVSSPKMDDDAVLAMRPLPSSVAHGSFTTNEDDITNTATTREWASPAPSNRRLLSQGSSHGHLDNVAPLSRNTTVSTTRLEPVRKGTIL